MFKEPNGGAGAPTAQDDSDQTVNRSTFTLCNLTQSCLQTSKDQSTPYNNLFGSILLSEEQAIEWQNFQRLYTNTIENRFGKLSAIDETLSSAIAHACALWAYLEVTSTPSKNLEDQATLAAGLRGQRSISAYLSGTSCLSATSASSTYLPPFFEFLSLLDSSQILLSEKELAMALLQLCYVPFDLDRRCTHTIPTENTVESSVIRTMQGAADILAPFPDLPTACITDESLIEVKKRLAAIARKQSEAVVRKLTLGDIHLLIAELWLAGHPSVAKASKTPPSSHTSYAGFTVRETPADGNCFFHAVADQLTLLRIADSSGSQYTHDILRAITLSHVDSAPEFKAILQASGEYTALSANGGWVGDGSIVALERLLHVNIHVHGTSDTRVPDSDAPRLPTLHLLYTPGHYSSLTPTASADTVVTISPSAPSKESAEHSEPKKSLLPQYGLFYNPVAYRLLVIAEQISRSETTGFTETDRRLAVLVNPNIALALIGPYIPSNFFTEVMQKTKHWKSLKEVGYSLTAPFVSDPNFMNEHPWHLIELLQLLSENIVLQRSSLPFDTSNIKDTLKTVSHLLVAALNLLAPASLTQSEQSILKALLSLGNLAPDGPIDEAAAQYLLQTFPDIPVFVTNIIQRLFSDSSEHLNLEALRNQYLPCMATQATSSITTPIKGPLEDIQISPARHDALPICRPLPQLPTQPTLTELALTESVDLTQYTQTKVTAHELTLFQLRQLSLLLAGKMPPPLEKIQQVMKAILPGVHQTAQMLFIFNFFHQLANTNKADQERLNELRDSILYVINSHEFVQLARQTYPGESISVPANQQAVQQSAYVIAESFRAMTPHGAKHYSMIASALLGLTAVGATAGLVVVAYHRSAEATSEERRPVAGNWSISLAELAVTGIGTASGVICCVADELWRQFARKAATYQLTRERQETPWGAWKTWGRSMFAATTGIAILGANLWFISDENAYKHAQDWFGKSAGTLVNLAFGFFTAFVPSMACALSYHYRRVTASTQVPTSTPHQLEMTETGEAAHQPLLKETKAIEMVSTGKVPQTGPKYTSISAAATPAATSVAAGAPSASPGHSGAVSLPLLNAITALRETPRNKAGSLNNI